MERFPQNEVIAVMEDARRFSQVMSNRLVQHEYRRLARDVVEMGVPPGGKVLDVGTGPGFAAIVGFNEVARVLKDDGGCIIRDSKRLQRRMPRLFAWTIGMTIPPDFRVHYWNSIKSSYTTAELDSILERSKLTGWRIIKDFMDLMIVLSLDK